jgi:hypothetical protein
MLVGGGDEISKQQECRREQRDETARERERERQQRVEQQKEGVVKLLDFIISF